MKAKTKKVFGPKGKWVSGHLDDFRNDPLGFSMGLMKDYTDIAKIRFGHMPIYVFFHPDLIKEVLVTKQGCFKKSKAFDEMKPFVGEGLLTSEGDFHLRQRRMIQPSFTKQHIRTYGDDMATIANQYVSNWKDGEERKITADMMNVTLAIISKTMFSMDLEETYESIGDKMEFVEQVAVKRMRSLINLPYFIKTKENKEFYEGIEVLDEIVYGFIEQRRKDPEGKSDLLAVLMAARDEEDKTGMTDKQLRDEAMTIFLAGHETTANALSWALYCLATHPEKEAKLLAEIDEVVGKRKVNADDFEKLSYTQNVIWETLRMYPPAWMFGREAKEDVQIGEYVVKKGESVFISPYLMHHSEKYFSKPEEFQPERFENQFVKSLPPYAFFPFGGGPRVCIGNHFAVLEAAMVLVTLYQKFTFRLTENHPPVEGEPLITLKPRNGLNMVVSKRV
ncbi:cytochrome P450 [Bacillus timonensis]|nr:cytochrome P450 [Bacillus timonensis]